MDTMTLTSGTFIAFTVLFGYHSYDAFRNKEEVMGVIFFALTILFAFLGVSEYLTT